MSILFHILTSSTYTFSPIQLKETNQMLVRCGFHLILVSPFAFSYISSFTGLLEKRKGVKKTTMEEMKQRATVMRRIKSNRYSHSLMKVKWTTQLKGLIL